MITLQLSESDAAVLRDVLTHDITDLGMEIADTDRMEFRDRLKDRKATLRRIVQALAIHESSSST